jgi:hypothetical protein
MKNAGRPLRALALGVLALPLWLVSRLPAIEQRFTATMAGMNGKPASRELAQQHRTPAVLVAYHPSSDVALVLSEAKPRRRPQGPMAKGASHPTPASANNASQPLSNDRMTGTPAPATKGPLPAFNLDPARPAPPTPGFDLATQAYARLAAGDRRDADRLFAAAITAGPTAPQAGQWANERRQLSRRWSGDAYSLLRDAGAGGAAATPVLGGGQSGASIGFTLGPLARRPLALIGRIYAAHDDRGTIDGATAQAAIGLRWQPLPGVSLAAERLIGIGRQTRGDWNLRLAAGAERRVGQVTLDGYGEAGARGNGDIYAGGQARAALALGAIGPVQIAAGPGIWGSVQSGFATVGRVDIGAGATARLPAGLAARADWRWRVAGNAAPGNGPAVTVSWAF